MACWSAENATKAYLRTMRMGKSEPNGAEFISALAAGNNAQLMVVACSGAADSTTLALLAAAQQTRGRLVCILRSQEELVKSQTTLDISASSIDFVVGDAWELISSSYRESDFIAIDCNLENHEEIMSSLMGRLQSNTIVLGYNAFRRESWKHSPLRTSQLLPIGEGLLLTRVAAAETRSSRKNWIVKVDKCTGEEHVFRVRSSVGRTVRA